MPLYDKPLEELLVYDPPMTREADFESFWAETLAESASSPLNARLQDVSYPAIGVRVCEVYYDGWRGARICAWYLVPEGDGPFPALVQYHGSQADEGVSLPQPCQRGGPLGRKVPVGTSSPDGDGHAAGIEARANSLADLSCLHCRGRRGLPPPSAV